MFPPCSRSALAVADAGQLERLAEWLDREPEVPSGPWYMRLPGMTVCGEGDLIKMFLLPGQSPRGTKVD